LEARVFQVGIHIFHLHDYARRYIPHYLVFIDEEMKAEMKWFFFVVGGGFGSTGI
jgi:hypothetical protein